MPRKVLEKTTKRRTKPIMREAFPSTEEVEEQDFGQMLRGFISGPLVKYIASGIAAAYLLRLANNMSDKYPEISTFIKENMDMLETKLNEYKDQLQHTEFTQRH
jgi:hypothetical protein